MTHPSIPLRNPYALLSVVIVLLWCIFDFSSRLISPDNAHRDSRSASELLVVPTLTLSEQNYQRQLQRYQSFYEQQEPEQSEERLSEEQIAAQSGQQTEVFFDKGKLVLKAVITEPQTDQRYALIAVYHNDNGDSLERVFNNNPVHGFVLRIVNNRKVILSRKIADNEQVIELVMYKTANNQ